jgi:hypothetical protein
MEVSERIAPFRAVLANTLLLVKLQPIHGLLEKQLIETRSVTHKYGAIQRSFENTLSFSNFQQS